MNFRTFDWRWIGLIVLIALIASAGSLPWPVTALALLAGGGYMVWEGWNAWRRAGGAPTRSNRVTYWRGQRYEVGPERPGPALPEWSGLRSAWPQLLVGGVLILAGLAIVLRALGL